MAVSRALKRLLRVRAMEEEQSRLELDAALSDLVRVDAELERSIASGRGGRRLVHDSAASGEVTDRVAGLEQIRSAERRSGMLVERRAAVQAATVRLREEYLRRRVERRQAETLTEEAARVEAVEAGRRSQQGLDDWHRVRRGFLAREQQPGAAKQQPSTAAGPDDSPVAK